MALGLLVCVLTCLPLPPVIGPDFGDCNGVASDGCEASLTTTSNCGACSQPCNLDNAQADCSAGTCALVACNQGASPNGHDILTCILASRLLQTQQIDSQARVLASHTPRLH